MEGRLLLSLALSLALFQAVYGNEGCLILGEGGGEPPEQFCFTNPKLQCRKAEDPRTTNSLTEICFVSDELETLFQANNVSDSHCGEGKQLALRHENSTNTPDVIKCVDNDAGGSKCIDDSMCINGFCCSEAPFLHKFPGGFGEFVSTTRAFRQKRAVGGKGKEERENARKQRRKERRQRKEEIEENRAQRKKERRQGKKDEEDDVEQLTTQAPDEKNCERVIVKGEIHRTYNGPITSVKLIKPLGYHDDDACKKKDYHPEKGSNKFKVTNCFAIFKVCYKPGKEPEGTTQAAAFTTEAEKECIVLENVKGLIKKCPNKIVSIDYIPAPKNNKKNNKHPGYGYVHEEEEEPCEGGKDYFVRQGTNFVANANCPGRFRICHLAPKPTQALTTEKPAENVCRNVVALKKLDKRLDGPITKVVLIKEFHDLGKCRLDDTYGAEGNRFRVTDGCRGVFKVCFQRQDQTTLPLTTEAPEQECEKLINVHGVKQRFDGDIVTVTYIPAQQPHSSGGHGGFGGYGHNTYNGYGYGCQKEFDYTYLGNLFVANARCVGFFEICYKLPKPTTAPLTTKLIEPVCEKVVVHNDGRQTFNGLIQSVTLVKQVPIFFGYHSFSCKEERDFTFEDDTLIVKNGCLGLYKVCYFENTERFTTEKPKKEKKKKGKGNKGKKGKKGKIH